jgi:hypothetical protein
MSKREEVFLTLPCHANRSKLKSLKGGGGGFPWRKGKKRRA